MVAAGGAIAAAAALVVLYRFDPATSPFYPPCVLHELTGLHCAGCGSLRAAHALVHGDWRGALALNPATTLAIPLLAIAVAAGAWRRARGAEPWRPPAWSILALAAAIVAWAVLRNLPGLDWLAPRG
jgi:hypothetical protein